MSYSQNIKVYVRCRPLECQERQSILEVIPPESIRVRDDRSENAYKNFQYDRVFPPDAAQIDVYKTVVRPLIDQVLQGFECTVFAYGQTGTGKTYTMEGDRFDDVLNWEDDPHCGLIPRSISQMIDSLKRQDNEYTLRVSFVELYNEDLYDLLSPADDITKLKIFDDVQRKGSVIINGLHDIVVQSKDEIYDILRQGAMKRQTASTLLNACSSRSHTIFNITVQIKEASLDGAQLIKTGKLNLVDLAGSECIKSSGAQDKRAREAGNINSSLLTLGRVITALVEKRPHVPYRESKLTRILQSSLGGASNTSIIATISPAPMHISNTLSTLDYAIRARNIINKPESDQQLTQKRTLAEYNKALQTLEDRMLHEKSELEFKVRNEVAVEFKREMQSMKQMYEDQYNDREERFRRTYENRIKSLTEENDTLTKRVHDLETETNERVANLETQLKEKTDEISTINIKNADLEKSLETKDGSIGELQDRLADFEKKIETNEREVKVAHQLAEYRASLMQDLEAELRRVKLEMQTLREEYMNLLEKARENSPEKANQKKATKVRKAPVLEDCGEYANMTFDGGDEILQLPSAKKSRKTVVAGTKRRAINETIVLSGKKKRLRAEEDEPELSPMVPVQRVTRSRATRRKLDY